MSFWTLRRRVSAALLTLVLLGAGWAVMVVDVAVTGARDQATTADAIAVLGAAQYNGHPSPVFRARLDHAATLYLRGFAPVVLVTGGVGSGDSISEAEVGRRYLRQVGLPDQAVIALAPTTSTHASLEGVGQWFAGRASRRVVLVSDGFHMLRLRIIATRLGLAPFTSPAPNSPIHANPRRNTTYMLAEGIKVPVAWLFQH
ncbi:MAG TPA: YdcF family protein [Gemmatimonadales bacterium]|nr:YdcF family protein [Gemmatimonadales bacterium]